MIHWSLTDDATGAVIRTGTAMTQAQANAQQVAGTTVHYTFTEPATQYIPPGSGGVVTSRPAMVVGATPTAADKASIFANGTDVLTITPVPAGAMAYITVPSSSGIAPIAPTEVNDGEVEVTTTVAGAYSVRITSGIYSDFVANFNAI